MVRIGDCFAIIETNGVYCWKVLSKNENGTCLAEEVIITGSSWRKIQGDYLESYIGSGVAISALIYETVNKVYDRTIHALDDLIHQSNTMGIINKIKKGDCFVRVCDNESIICRILHSSRAYKVEYEYYQIAPNLITYHKTETTYKKKIISDFRLADSLSFEKFIKTLQLGRGTIHTLVKPKY